MVAVPTILEALLLTTANVIGAVGLIEGGALNLINRR